MMFSRVNQRTNHNLNKSNSYFHIPLRQYTTPSLSNKTKIPEPVKKPIAVMKWGKPTWYFLHMLAQRVKEYEFQNIRDGLLKTIYIVCTNLPCPNCSSHAKQYLNKINFNTIETKRELIKILFTFHNLVNERKSFPIFSEHELSMYDNINIVPCINNFMGHFVDKSGSYKLMANDLHRVRIIGQVKTWLQENLGNFE